MRVSQLFQRFSQYANAITPAPILDERSRPFYLLLICALVVQAVCFWFLGLTVSIEFFSSTFLALAWMVLAALLARRYGHPRIALFLEAVSLPGLCGVLIAVGSFLTTIISLPLADDLLEAADTAIGFDWLAVFSLYQNYPWLLEPSRIAYNSMFFQLSVVPILLVIAGQANRLWEFLTALAIAGVVTVIVHPLFPAAGPFLQYDLQPQDLPRWDQAFRWTTGEIIERIRMREISDVTSAMNGLVSMPSFHAISAVILAWASCTIRWVGIPFVVLNIAMWLATIVIGSHYFIDLLLGTLVAVIAIIAAKRIVSRAGSRSAADNP